MLILVLLLLAVAATALAQVSRRSYEAAAQAIDAEGQLQRQWLLKSAQRAMLERPERLLSTLGPRPVEAEGGGVVRLELELEAGRVELILADEQAKANVNAMLGWEDGERVQRRLETLIDAHATGRRLALRPVPGSEAANGGSESRPAGERALLSFDQLLAPAGQGGATPDWLLNAQHPVAERITLWGEGPVHWHRAPAQVLEAVLAPHLGAAQIDTIVRLRREHPAMSSEALFSELAPSEQQRRRLEQRLTDRSQTWSLWFRYDDGRRTWTRLLVREQGATRPYRFEW